jgi:hypothetical protein
VKKMKLWYSDIPRVKIRLRSLGFLGNRVRYNRFMKVRCLVKVIVSRHEARKMLVKN